MRQRLAVLSAVTVAGVFVTAVAAYGLRGNGGGAGTRVEEEPVVTLSMVTNQIGEIPKEGNPIEQAIQAYTGVRLKIGWVPSTAYDDKINVMIASRELPKLLKVNYTPAVIGSLAAGLFWEIGPYLQQYRNFSAQPRAFFDNVAVEGKLYGIPLFRNMGRVSLVYRKDWLDAQGGTLPVTLEDWYRVIRAGTLEDPDGNGKQDTYGMMLDKNYNQGTASTLSRFAVAQGAPNKWGVDQAGNFIPEFAAPEYLDTLKLFRRLYAEKLINPDFAVVDASTIDRAYESGKAAFRLTGGNAQTIQNQLEKLNPTARVDSAPLEGPRGIRVPDEGGNAGMLVFPKSAVKTEQELRQILSFLDKLLDPPMVNVLVKGVEGRHYRVEGEFTVPLNKDLDYREVKPYRDTFPNRDEQYHMDRPSKDTALARKSKQIGYENEQYAVPNPALTLDSPTYAERGKELELQIADAQTLYIMGKIDEEGWKAEVERWRLAGGNQIAREYKEAYSRVMR
ncbi:extracellular solute-binding protein [Paenibacillus mesotrionivorans]|uniref:Extracellular solute-binding protein n=1 Tax=Paenibacillus mesotrionivorans TaxID=3160968 RepID=A0ACC7P445_9BACL